MKENWKMVLGLVLVSEGGYDNDSRDPGGITLQGILQTECDKFCDENGIPRIKFSPALIKDPHWIEVRDAIYRKKYADVVRFDDLPAGVDYTVCDGGINSGNGQSVKWTQRELVGIEADGKLGDKTLAAILNFHDKDKLIVGSLLRRQKFLEALKTFQYFGRGWTSRVNSVRSISTAMADGSILPAPGFEKYAQKKAVIEDAKPVVIKPTGEILVNGGKAAGGGALTGVYSPWLAGAIVAGVVVVAGGLFYLNYRHNNKAAALADALGVGEIDPNEKPLHASM